MKSTGVTRRIDELGRIVIPKEVRKALKIREGSPLEFYLNDKKELVLKKYSPIFNMEENANSITECIYEVLDEACVICDMEYIVAVSGCSKKEFLNCKISEDMVNIIQKRNIIKLNGAEIIKKLIDIKNFNPSNLLIAPIIIDSDAMGAIVIFNYKEKTSYKEIEEKLLQFASLLLNKI